ncbi:GAF and ANTAR domain-containing protein [Nocardioides sp. zg-1308]|uniref:GAF domain-containing protein n=1 Tax=Nocardioides sp. zg-1308 TaxID=2736253 RepID=UPI001557391F|nr:GAF domain-containing protein [Nocardioides sp. zg-1308]NPD03859.1 GAF and ANTAR domain-containing protein [Nocardioides sp. zg-1308]
MKPIPETLEALAELDALHDDGTLLVGLCRATASAQRLAPGLVGASVASREHGLTFTLVATDDEIAALDGVQYLSSGPCVDVADAGEGIATTSEDLFSEPRWRSFAQATAAAGVHSTLTFPIMGGAGRLTGTVNLYGSSEHTFDGKHARLAEVFRAWAPGAVTNADLAFSTRLVAEQAPALMREEALVETATGILAAHRRVSVEVAREQLEDSAARAGVQVSRLARVIIEIHHDD